MKEILTKIVIISFTIGLLTACDISSSFVDMLQAKMDIDNFAYISYREMVTVPGILDSSYIQTTTDGYSFTHNISGFELGKYEVSYELWYEVNNWASSNGYSFGNLGAEGSLGIPGATPSDAKFEPVTTINWRDAIVWCNAYSEMSGFTPVYTFSGSVIRDSTDTNATVCDGADWNFSADGYRLPTEGEWQYAASYKDGINWTESTFASGAYTYHDDITDVNPTFGVVDGKEANDEIAIYDKFYDDDTVWKVTGVYKTVSVGTKNANQLAIYDMSGNAMEMCWDWHGVLPNATVKLDYRGLSPFAMRVSRGGSWAHSSLLLQVGNRAGLYPYDGYDYLGFRVARYK